MMVAMLPVPPELPAFPLDLDWQYDAETDRYSLDAAGVDQLLDYRDNELPLYEFKMQVYQEEVASIVEHIKSLNL